MMGAEATAVLEAVAAEATAGQAGLVAEVGTAHTVGPAEVLGLAAATEKAAMMTARTGVTRAEGTAHTCYTHCLPMRTSLATQARLGRCTNLRSARELRHGAAPMLPTVLPK